MVRKHSGWRQKGGGGGPVTGGTAAVDDEGDNRGRAYGECTVAECIGRRMGEEMTEA